MLSQKPLNLFEKTLIPLPSECAENYTPHLGFSCPLDFTEPHLMHGLMLVCLLCELHGVWIELVELKLRVLYHSTLDMESAIADEYY
jgi:hypothetical protein